MPGRAPARTYTAIQGIEWAVVYMSYLGNIGATEEILPLVYFFVIFSILAGILGYILSKRGDKNELS